MQSITYSKKSQSEKIQLFKAENKIFTNVL